MWGPPNIPGSLFMHLTCYIMLKQHSAVYVRLRNAAQQCVTVTNPNMFCSQKVAHGGSSGPGKGKGSCLDPFGPNPSLLHPLDAQNEPSYNYAKTTRSTELVTSRVKSKVESHWRRTCNGHVRVRVHLPIFTQLVLGSFLASR